MNGVKYAFDLAVGILNIKMNLGTFTVSLMQVFFFLALACIGLTLIFKIIK